MNALTASLPRTKQTARERNEKEMRKEVMDVRDFVVVTPWWEKSLSSSKETLR